MAKLAIDYERGLPDEFIWFDKEVAPIGHQLPDFGEHALCEFGMAGGEGDDDCFRIFAE